MIKTISDERIIKIALEHGLIDFRDIAGHKVVTLPDSYMSELFKFAHGIIKEIEQAPAVEPAQAVQSESCSNLMWATAKMREREHNRIGKMVGVLEQIKQEKLSALEPAQAVPVAHMRVMVGCRAPDDCEEYFDVCNPDDVGIDGKAFPVYREPPAIVEAVPVGVIDQSDDGYFVDFDWSSSAAGSVKIGAKVYTAPPAIDDETKRMVLELCKVVDNYTDIPLTQQIREKLGAGNGN